MLMKRADLEKLAMPMKGPVISIYMPTHSTSDTEQDPIRFRNLLRKAEDVYEGKGLRRAEARELLKPASELLDDSIFWQHLSEGLALFRHTDFFYYYRVPLEFDESVTVDNRCYVRPLLTLLHGDGLFYALALSQNKVRLLQCTREQQRLVTPDGVPSSIAETLKYDELEKQHQFHTTGQGPAIFHGQGAAKDYDKEHILRYCRDIDRGLHPVLREEKIPLVPVSVEYIQAIYRKANTYANITDEGVYGNPDEWSDAEIRQSALQVIQPMFSRRKEAALERYSQGTGTGLSLSDIGDILLAAHDGRVAVLMIAEGATLTGVFKPESREVELTDGNRPEARDLLEAAALDTLLRDGETYIISPDEMPTGTKAAAVARY